MISKEEADLQVFKLAVDVKTILQSSHPFTLFSLSVTFTTIVSLLRLLPRSPQIYTTYIKKVLNHKKSLDQGLPQKEFRSGASATNELYLARHVRSSTPDHQVSSTCVR